MEDFRLNWLREKLCSSFSSIKSVEIQSWFKWMMKRNNDIVTSLLNDAIPFEILFFRKSSEYVELEKQEAAKNGEEEFTRPVHIPLMRMDVDEIKESIHPHDIQVFYVQRLKAGPIPKAKNIEDAVGKMEEYLTCGFIDEDPLKMIKEIISDDYTSEIDSLSDRHVDTFINEINKLCGDVKGEADIEIPKDVYVLYKVPFNPEEAAKNESALVTLTNVVWKWTEEVSRILKDINEIQKSEDEKHSSSNTFVLISDEILCWQTKLARLKTLEKQLNIPWIRKSLLILSAGKIPQAEEFKRHFQQVNILLEEAEDNVKFLGTIGKPTDILSSSLDFPEMISLLPTIMSSIRNIWVISKHYNTDSKICGLLTKITNIIVFRVKSFIKFDLLNDPDKAKEVAANSGKLLVGWKKEFEKTRGAIELSEREARWEFPFKELFAPLDHSTDVCSDIVQISEVLSELSRCFSPALIQMTSKRDAMLKAKEKITFITDSFMKLSFDAFEVKNVHHWKIHVSWFEREVRFLDSESASIAEETFNYLNSSRSSIDALGAMLNTNYRRAIGDRFIDKIDFVIKKFSEEIHEAEVNFDLNKKDPLIVKDLPPISGAIYWAKNIGSNLEETLNSLKRVPQVVSHSTWRESKSVYDSFQRKLKEYRENRYKEWKSRVSDVLAENLTRTLLLAEDPKKGFLSKRYKVNFTTDLSHTLAEVKHLDSLGFSVPEVAKNMSLQEERLIGVADDLRTMLHRYHSSLDEICEAEEELLFQDIQNNQIVLRPGHIRITWNSLGIKEFILRGNQSISYVKTKINHVELLRNELESVTESLAQTNLLEFESHLDHEAQIFNDFFQNISSNIKTKFGALRSSISSMTPRLVKIEEILVQTRSRRAPRLKNYYAHWEMKIYKAVINLICVNLDSFKQFLESSDPKFFISAVLVDNNVAIEPSAPTVLEVIIGVVREILERCKMFVRHYKGTWIPCKSIRVKDEIKPVTSSLYDDIIRLPEIIDRVTDIQNVVVGILKDADFYLISWKSFRTLWKFNKQQTCENFGRTIPTCVDFDEKLLFYYNLHRSIRSKEDFVDFKVLRLELTKLKSGIEGHISEWIQVLGKMLDSTASEKLKDLWDRVETYGTNLKQIASTSEVEDVLQVISGIWSMSLEVEIGYMDIQERYRTLEMYGISGDSKMVEMAKTLILHWDELYLRSKKIYFSLEKLKERQSEIENCKIKRFQSRLEDLREDFLQNGPSAKRTSLNNGLKALEKFLDSITAFETESENLNKRQKIFKIPVTRFPILCSLRSEMNTLEKIYGIFEKLQALINQLRNYSWKEYFSVTDKPPSYILDPIEKDIAVLENSIPNEGLEVLEKLKDQFSRLRSYLFCFERLEKGNVATRHWKVIRHETSLFFNEDEQSSYPEFKLGPFLDLQLKSLVSTIDSVLLTAEKEIQIETEYDCIVKAWESRKFLLGQFEIKKSSVPIITNFPELIDQLESDDKSLEVMLSTKYSDPFKEKLGNKRIFLTNALHILKFRKQIQADCITYSKVFLSAEKSEYADEFLKIFQMYDATIDEVKRKTIVIDCLFDKTITSEYLEISDNLKTFKSKCEHYLAKRKSAFPRLYFLSNEEIFYLLGGWCLTSQCSIVFDENEYNRIVRKLFGFGFSNIVVGSSDEVTSLKLFNGDELRILKRIIVNSTSVGTFINELSWLQELVKEMRRSFSYMIRKALNSNIETSLSYYISKPELLSLINYEVYWTKSIEKCVKNNQLQDQLGLLTEKIGSIVGQEMENCSFKEKEKRGNFINLLLSKQILLKRLINFGISSVDDFDFKSEFLRSYWEKDSEILSIEQGTASMDFEYEFQAPETNFITESTNATYGIMMALASQMRAFCLSGNIGVGKTTLIKSMAARLGRYCVRITNYIDRKAESQRILELFAWACESDCWIVLENVKNFSMTALSTISNPLNQIEAAKDLRLQQFNLTPNKEINLGPNAAILFTMREADISHPPQSLRSRWRHVSLIPPGDLSSYITWKMISKGFTGIDKFTALLKDCLLKFSRLSENLMKRKGPFIIVNEIFNTVEINGSSENQVLAKAILKVCESYLNVAFIPGVKDILVKHFGEIEEKDKTDVSMDKEILEEWNRQFLRTEGIPGGVMTSQQIQVTKLLFKNFSLKRALVVISNESGVGKDLITKVLAGITKSEILPVYSYIDESEIFGESGILSHALTDNAKKYIVLFKTTPTDFTASQLAEIIDAGVFQSSTKRTIPANNMRLVFHVNEEDPQTTLHSVLIPRCQTIRIHESSESIIRMNANLHFDFDGSMMELFDSLSRIEIEDPMMDCDSSQRTRQMMTIYEQYKEGLTDGLGGELKNLHRLKINILVFAYLWSYGGTLQDPRIIGIFDERVKNVCARFSDEITILRSEGVFEQKFDGNEWVSCKDPLREILKILMDSVVNGIFLIGGLATEYYAEAVIEGWEDYEIRQISLKQFSKGKNILQADLTTYLCTMGNRILQPKTSKKFLYFIKNLKNVKDREWAKETASFEYIYTPENTYLNKVRFLVTVSEKVKGFAGGVFSLKPMQANLSSLDMFLKLTEDFKSEEKKEITEFYTDYKNRMSNEELSSIFALELTNVDVFSKLLVKSSNGQNWKSLVSEKLLVPLWSSPDFQKTKSFLNEWSITPSDKDRELRIKEAMSFGTKVLLIGPSGAEKRRMLDSLGVRLYLSVNELRDSFTEDSDGSKTLKALESLAIPEDLTEFQNFLDSAPIVTEPLIISLNVDEYSQMKLKYILCIVRNEFEIIGVPHRSRNELE